MGKIDDAFCKNLACLIYGEVATFIDRYKLQSSVVICEPILDKVIEDLIADFRRIKDFHKMNNLSFAKITAYSAGWLIRRKPLQIGSGTNNLRFVNESFAFFLVLQGIGFGNPNQISGLGIDKKYYDHMFEQIKYYMKYRNCNTQMLELLIVCCQDCLHITYNDKALGKA